MLTVELIAAHYSLLVRRDITAHIEALHGGDVAGVAPAAVVLCLEVKVVAAATTKDLVAFSLAC